MDEVQYTIPKSWYKPIFFDTEEEAKAYDYKIPSPLHFSEKLNKWYYDGDNLLNQTIAESIDKATSILGIKVPLGYEYSVGLSWADTH